MHNMLVAHDFFLPLIYIALVVVSLVLYFTVSCMDPGFVKEGDPDVEKVSSEFSANHDGKKSHRGLK